MQNLYYVNISESQYRNWDDCKQYNFLAAGGAQKRINQISSLYPGDWVAAYLKGKGYVGIGIVEERAVPVEQFYFSGLPLSSFELIQPGILSRAGKHEICDHLVKLKWMVVVDRMLAKWEKGLFASQNVKASLSNQPKTISFLENAFQISMH